MQTQLYYRLPDLVAMLPVSKHTILKMVQSGHFPKPIKIGKRAVAWSVSEIQDWLKRKEAERQE